MKVLVTGADGFIGSHLCDILLKNNYEVIAVSRNFKKLLMLLMTWQKFIYVK
ncbi:NAD-dependent epimerase/dehydratase family protein [Candidatus Nitrosarchaeum limnium]|nr:NAD-dependent epimerase/dehydratase family protein [Candidatus Nitrosarchaeum limnium]